MGCQEVWLRPQSGLASLEAVRPCVRVYACSRRHCQRADFSVIGTIRVGASPGRGVPHWTRLSVQYRGTGKPQWTLAYSQLSQCPDLGSGSPVAASSDHRIQLCGKIPAELGGRRRRTCSRPPTWSGSYVPRVDGPGSLGSQRFIILTIVSCTPFPDGGHQRPRLRR